MAEDGRGPSIWDTYSHTPGRTHNGDTGDVACDHYHRYPEDVALMGSVGVNAYRFSISWSRLLPDGETEVNEKAIEFYRKLCIELAENEIVPVATLYHWDLPQTLQDRGGWLNPDSAGWFARYAAVAKESLGDLVHIWSTLNEPWCSAFLGHSAGEHAPGLTDPASAFVAAHNQMLAHHGAIAVMRETLPQPNDRLGVVLNLIPAWPASDSSEDEAAAVAVDAVQNRLFLEAVFAGTYPEEILAHHARYGVGDEVDPEALAVTRQEIDYLGVNYYNINRFEHVDGAPAPGPWPGAEGARLTRPPGHLTEMGWGVEPEGLLWMLRRIHNEHPGLPLMVCENGAAYPDLVVDGSIDDPDRIEYLRSHIAAVYEAITQGVDVRGYFVWSLLDNFEWARGYSKRFGLVHVDFDTLERKIKASGHWYRDFLAGAPI